MTMKAKCPKCLWRWQYRGTKTGKEYITCPNCHNKNTANKLNQEKKTQINIKE